MHVADSKNSRGLALTTTLSTAVAAQGLVTQKNISLAMAPTIAQAAVAQCESMGFKVSVTVVDRAGLPIVMLRGDGAGLHTPEGAERKAHTARTFSQPSADFVKAIDREAGDGRLAPIYARAGAGRRTADQGRQ